MPKVVLGLYLGFGIADRVLISDQQNPQPTIQQRVDAVRQKLQQDASYQIQTHGDDSIHPGQWWNWGNWPNFWNNWGNQWLNFGN